MLRNNAIYVISVSLVLLMVTKGKKQLKKLMLTTMFILCFSFFYSNIFLPMFHFTDGSIREALSVPFQQTARYVTTYPDEVTEKEREVISNVLDYGTIEKEYDPELSDPVKDTFNKYATTEDLKEYFEVWFQMFLKHPICYVEATLNNTYNYYYINQHQKIYYSSAYMGWNADMIGDRTGIYFELNDKFTTFQSIYLMFYSLTTFIPILGMLYNCSTYFWMIIIFLLYALMKKDWKKFVIFMIPFLYILTLLLGPSNGGDSFRYMFPMLYMFPIMIGVQMRDYQLI